jgi:hypothetical protein
MASRLSRLVTSAGLALLALLPACSESPTAPGPAGSAILTVTVSPNPITPDTLLNGFRVRYTVTITETAGVGGEFEAVNSTLFDEATGFQIAVNNYDAADMIVFVGSKRLEPMASVDVPKQIDYAKPGGGSAALLTVNVRFKDDKANTISQGLLVRVL